MPHLHASVQRLTAAAPGPLSTLLSMYPVNTCSFIIFSLAAGMTSVPYDYWWVFYATGITAAVIYSAVEI